MLTVISRQGRRVVLKSKCENCGKTIGSSGGGSLTGWLFRKAECKCEVEQKSEAENPPKNRGDWGSVGLTGSNDNRHADQQNGTDTRDNIVSLMKYAHESGDLIAESYEVIEPLGRGGMGEVYSVIDRRSQSVYALKIISPALGDQKILARRLEHEAEAAKSLTHANIASVYDVGRDGGGKPFLIMDYIVGENLEQLLRQEVFLQSQRALDLFIQIAEALAHAHGKGIVHRDLKPSNILLAKSDSGDDMVKLVDFGIAKLTDAHSTDKTKLTQTGDLIGSPST